MGVHGPPLTRVWMWRDRQGEVQYREKTFTLLPCIANFLPLYTVGNPGVQGGANSHP